MATFKIKMEKISLKKIVDRFFYYFDKGAQDAILKISMEMQQHLIFIKFI